MRMPCLLPEAAGRARSGARRWDDLSQSILCSDSFSVPFPSLQLVCGYHGWTYRLDGRLTKATRIKGIRDFNARDYGLVEIPLREWGHLLFLKFHKGRDQRAADGEPRRGRGGSERELNEEVSLGLKTHALIWCKPLLFFICSCWCIEEGGRRQGPLGAPVAPPVAARVPRLQPGPALRQAHRLHHRVQLEGALYIYMMIEIV